MKNSVYFFKDGNIFIKEKNQARQLNKKEIDELMKKIKSNDYKNLEGNNFVTFSNNEETIRFFGEKEFKDFYKNWKKRKNIKKGTVGAVIGVGALAATLILNSNIKNDKKDAPKENPIIAELPTTPPTIDVNKDFYNDKLKEIIKTLSELSVNYKKYQETKKQENENSEVTNNERRIFLDLNVIPSTDYEIDENVSKYDSIIEEKSKKWGLSPNFIRAMICHESAGQGDNITQIIFNSWKDQVITAYNFEVQKEYSFVLTDNPEKFMGKVDQIMTREEFLTPEGNIDAAGIIESSRFDKFKNNIFLAFMEYNFGSERLRRIMERYSNETGISADELINNPEKNVAFIKYVTRFDEEKVKEIDANAIAIMDENYTPNSKNVYVIGDVYYIYHIFMKNFNQLEFVRSMPDGSKVTTVVSYDLSLLDTQENNLNKGFTN